MAACASPLVDPALGSEPWLRRRTASPEPQSAAAKVLGPRTTGDSDVPSPSSSTKRVLEAIEDPEVVHRLRSRARRRVRDWALAEDCVQEALLQAFLHADQLQTVTVYPWLCTIVTNVCRMELRARGRKRRGGDAKHLDVTDVGDECLQASEAEHPEASLIAHELARGLAKIAAEAPPDDVELMRAYLEHAGSTVEFAEERASTKQVIKSRVYRIRKRLHERLVHDQLLEVG